MDTKDIAAEMAKKLSRLVKVVEVGNGPSVQIDDFENVLGDVVLAIEEAKKALAQYQGEA